MPNRSISDSSRQLLNIIVLDLRAEQRECWERGERILIENFLDCHSSIWLHEDSVLELLYSEFCLRDEIGDRPEPEEYSQRFPQYSQRLLRLIGMHRVLDEMLLEPDAEDEAPCVTSNSLILTRADFSLEEWCWEFKETPQTIGRGGSADICLVHPLISKQHCRFWKDSNVSQIEDCGSTNGTFVNNQRIKCRVLAAGDRIRVGGVELLVREKEEAQSSF